MGRRVEVSTDDVMELFEDSPCEPRNAPEVADLMKCSETTARKRLQECWEMGQLHRKTFGGQYVVYWVRPDEVE